jgi:hypothetical protein
MIRAAAGGTPGSRHDGGDGFTPGPWAARAPQGIPGAANGRFVIIAAAAGVEVLICEQPYAATIGGNIAIYEANATLIAAAPVLLAALRRCAQLLHVLSARLDGEPEASDCADALVESIAAIEAAVRARPRPHDDHRELRRSRAPRRGDAGGTPP